MSSSRAICSPDTMFGTVSFNGTLRHQTGVATLVVILILLFSISGLTLYAANTGILEQKISINDYRAKQLGEASDAGVDVGVSWLTTNTPVWVTDTLNAGYEKHNGIINTTFSNGLSANILLRRSVAAPEKVTLIATAMESAGTSTTATSRTEILQNKFVSTQPDTPLLINGCLSGITGNPTANNTSDTYDIVSSQSAGCIDTGHFNNASDPVQVLGSAFTGTAWDRTFGITQAEMQALALADASLPIADRTVHWITDPSPWHTNLGSSTAPIKSVIAVFTACQAINGGTDIVGIVFFMGPCTSGGWGGGDIFGSVVMEGNMEAMNANTSLTYDDQYVTSLFNKTLGLRARIPGSWIDQGS